jgi:hypothetical protein
VLVPRSSGYLGLANLGSESEACVGSRVHLVGVSISFEKNFYRLPFTPPSLVCRIGPSATPARPLQARCWGVTRKIRTTTLTRVRVLNAFKYKVRAQRDCDSLYK